MMLKILYRAYNQPGNLGDLMLNRGLVSLLRRYGSVHLCAGGFSGADLEVIKSWGVVIERGRNGLVGGIRWLFRALVKREWDCLIEYPGIRPIGSGYLVRRVFVVLVYGLLRLRGCRVIIPNIAYDLNRITKEVLRAESIVARIVNLYGVRDVRLFDVMCDNGVCRVRYVPDVFFLNCAEGLPKRLGRVRKRVVLVFRESIPGADSSTYKKALIAQLVNIVASLNERCEFIIACHCLSDSSFSRELGGVLSEYGDVRVYGEVLTVESAFDLYSGSDLILSNRLHAVLFAFSVGSCGVFVTDADRHDKVAGAVYTYGCVEYLVDIWSSREEAVCRVNRSLDRGGVEVWERIVRLRKDCKEIIEASLFGEMVEG